jgi:hypothetical protein
MSPEISPKVQRPESHQKDGKSMPPGERPKDVEIGQKGKKKLEEQQLVLLL